MAHLFSVAVLSLYITWRAYQTMAGKLVRPFEEIVWDVSRMLIIMIFVTNAGGYLDLVSDAITGLRDGFSGDASIWARLDTVWEKAQALGEKLYSYDDSTYVALKGTLAQFLVWAGVMLLVGITAIINLIAELVMLLMLATAPDLYLLPDVVVVPGYVQQLAQNYSGLHPYIPVQRHRPDGGNGLPGLHPGGRHKSIRCQLPDSGRSGLPRHGGCRRRDGPDL